MKKILGLDLGTNSIGWAVVNADEKNRDDGSTYLKPYGISAAGSRIIPMSADILGDFEKGNTVSQTAERTRLRMARRLHERALLRRERLIRVLNLMGFLPKHFSDKVNRYGKFIDDSEPKLAWRKNAEGKYEFVFQESFNEMLEDFKKIQPELVAGGNKIPYDWTVYFLRKKALTQRISKEEFSWLLLQFNQKRGYYQLRGEEEEEKANETVEIIAAKVLSVERKEKDKKYDKYWYEMPLDNGLTYRASFYNDVSSWKNETKEFVLKTTILKDGSKKEELSFLPTPEEIELMDAPKKGKMYAKIKLRTEKNIENSHKTVGCYIYDSLLNNPKQKIIGKLVRTVERKFYKDELTKILRKQVEFIPEFQDENLYKKCIEELYPINEAHRNNIAKPDFVNLFINDILFYQRPLKSKKSQIDNCPYENHIYIYKNQEKNIEEKRIAPVKCIAKSNPLFQEFRLWQFVQNLRIYQREKEKDGKLLTDIDITSECLKSEYDYVKLFEWLNDREIIDQEELLKHLFNTKKSKNKELPYRWNYVEDKTYPCNETRAAILKGFSKCCIDISVLSPELEYALWHILYSVEDKNEVEKALTHFAQKQGWNENFAKIFSKIKPFQKDYGSYSEKAIKKLLPLMRMGKFWSQDNIDKNTLDRIDKIINGEYDKEISNRVRDNAINLRDVNDFRGLPVWLACYIVYDRHSEAKNCYKWNSPEDIDAYLKDFKQHSLRNPIVEQVVTETLRTVRDIWKQEGQIDEIHLELGRDLKNPADKRKKMSENILKNENTNLRIKAMLMEFMNPSMGVENVRPYSPSQQDILRIYEENALDNLTKEDEDFDFISKISKQAQPSKSDIVRYKCWLEQKYRSPYTGKTISLSKLFTSAYEIEHIIPQSRYFDDSFSNKVICEAEVNKLKDRQLGYEFIAEHHGEKIQLSQGEVVEIFSVNAYEKFVKENYASNRLKMKKLLMENIPDEFIERQLNDSRYISKIVKDLLSNIVREKIDEENYEQEAVSKNLISCNGTITDRLKKDWGMNDVWNSIVLPRFIRMNNLTKRISNVELANEFKRLFESELSCFAKAEGVVISESFPDFYKTLKTNQQRTIIDNVVKQLPITDSFLSVNNEGHIIPNMPLKLQKGFNKKRIDHRHHAMDAIVIACATRDHVNLLNNEAAHSRYNVNRFQLQRKLRRFEKTVIDGEERNVAKEFLKPWDSFAKDAKSVIENIIVSFKQNQRVINKTTNVYQHFDQDCKKIFVKQEKGDSWAIRKSMHKATFYGEINLRKIKSVSLTEAIKSHERILNKIIRDKVSELKKNNVKIQNIKKFIEDNHIGGFGLNKSKIDIYFYTKETKERFFATRKSLDMSFDKNKIENSLADSGIQKILLAHLERKNGNAEQAFSPDGIDEMNKNIVELNKGKFHQPILKVRVYEKAEKFVVGQNGNKKFKFVEAAKGTNMFFAVFEKNGKRSYLTIPLNVMIDCQKKYGNQWKNNIESYLKENKLTENDVKLLFILSPNDLVYLPTAEELKEKVKSVNKDRIYKFIDPNSDKGNFVPYSSANVIFSINFSDQKKRGVSYPIQDEFGVGSQGSKNSRAITGEMIKETCVPIKVDRLGNITELDGRRL